MCFYFLGLIFIGLNAHLIPDCFSGLSATLSLLDHTPYKDFFPYKNLLGKYLFLIPSFILDGWNYILASRIIVISTYILIVTLFLDIVSKKKILAPRNFPAVFFFLLSPTILETFYLIRVDLITNLLFILGVSLYLKEKKYFSFFMSLSFLCSQKAAILILPMTLFWIGEEFEKIKLSSKHFFIPFLWFTLPIAAYILFWGTFASPLNVIESLLLMKSQVKENVDAYALSNWQVWIEIIKDNFALGIIFVFCFFHILILSIRKKKNFHYPLAIASVIIIQIFFPVVYEYNMGKVIPILTIVILYSSNILLKKLSLFWMIFFKYSLLFLVLIQLMALDTNSFRGILFQKQNFKIVKSIMENYPDSYYFSGFQLLPDQTRSPKSLIWVDRFRRAELITMSQKDKNELFKSLLENKMILYVEGIISNNLFHDKPFRDFFQEYFSHYYGSIHTYSPKLNKTEGQYNIRISGSYQLKSKSTETVSINGVTYQNGQEIKLRAGIIKFKINGLSSHVRLKLIPKHNEELLLPQFKDRKGYFKYYL